MLCGLGLSHTLSWGLSFILYTTAGQTPRFLLTLKLSDPKFCLLQEASSDCLNLQQFLSPMGHAMEKLERLAALTRRPAFHGGPVNPGPSSLTGTHTWMTRMGSRPGARSREELKKLILGERRNACK